MGMNLGEFKNAVCSQSSDTLIVLNNGSDALNGEFVFDSGMLIFVVDFEETNAYSLGRLFDLVERHANEINDSTVMETEEGDESFGMDFTGVRVEDDVIVIYLD